jgi:hypothetical protein
MVKKQELRNLEQLWDRILRASGFIDIEKKIGEDRVLIQHASNAYRQADEVVRENKALYYQKLNEKMYEHRFSSEIEKRIMQRTSEGWLIKDILAELKRRGVKIHRQTIGYTIRRHENMWGLKTWSDKEMRLNRKTRTK